MTSRADAESLIAEGARRARPPAQWVIDTLAVKVARQSCDRGGAKRRGHG